MDLHPSEHILYEGRPSWRSILLFYILGLFAAIVGGVIAALIWDAGVGGLVGFLILVIVIVVGWLRRIGTRYFISNERLHIRRGIVSRRSQETRLERIQNVNTDQSVFERLLRIGTVDFDTAGGGDYDFAFRGVADPSRVSEAVDRAIREIDLGTGERTQAAPPPAPPPTQRS